MALSDEFLRHLLHDSGEQTGSVAGSKIMSEQDVDWSKIHNIVLRHRVASSFVNVLDNTAVEPPEEIGLTLEERVHETSLRNLEYSRQLHELSDLFDEYDITALPFKGPVLAEIAYDSVSDRCFDDLDFLVHREDVKEACQLLEQEGYKRINFPGISVETLIDGTVFRWGKELRFVNPDNGVPVELRFGFIGGEHSDLDIINEFWERRTTVPVAGEPLPALSPEDRALLVLVHGTKHGWRRLSWVSDTVSIVQQNIDWETVMMRAKKYRWRNATIYGLAVVEQLADVTVPDPVKSEMESNRLCLWGAQRTAAYIQNHPEENLGYLEPIATALYLNDELSGAVAEGINELCAPRKADYELIKLPQPLHPMYTFVRVYRVGRTKLRSLIDLCKPTELLDQV